MLLTFDMEFVTETTFEQYENSMKNVDGRSSFIQYMDENIYRAVSKFQIPDTSKPIREDVYCNSFIPPIETQIIFKN